MTDVDWLIDPGLAYLNHGGFGALPAPVAEVANEWRAEVEANPSDLLMRRWHGLVTDVRQAVANLLTADDSDLVFVPNASAGTATVLTSLDLAPGDEIVTTDHRYPAVASQIRVLSSRGVRVVETPIPLDATDVDDVVGAIVGNVSPRTKLVVIDHIASLTGFVFPIAEVVAAAHAAGVPVLVDGAHAPGQVAVDLRRLDADFWVGNLHKWVCSPRACAALYVAPAWQDRVRPLVASHDYFDGFQPAFDWTGTADPVPLLTIPAAIDFWRELGWDDVRRFCHELATTGAHLVADRLGTCVPIADEFTAAMRLIRLPRPMSQDARTDLTERMLSKHKVMVHTTHHQDTSYVRVCAQLYNVPEHYERLAVALEDLL